MDRGVAEAASIAYKVFTFEDRQKDRQESLSVRIPEVLDPQYGMYVWPCAVVLAQYLWTQREQLGHKTLLELGAGVSLPGVVAARCGAKVILSDSAETPVCLENCRRSCDANGLRDVEVLGLTWGEISPDLVLLPKLDVILGSDVFYDPRDFEDILVTVAFLLRKNPGAQFWTTYQERRFSMTLRVSVSLPVEGSTRLPAEQSMKLSTRLSADWSIEALLHRWKLNCVDIQLETFGADEAELAGSSLPGSHSILMMVITLKTEDDGL